MTDPSVADRPLLVPGDLLDGKYQIIRVLGEGGMGIVYEAFHQKLEQNVAIKMMLPSVLSHPTLAARFDREARAAAKIKSRHVARVFDVDVTPDGLPYIVMELLTGEDLATRLAAIEHLPVTEAVGHLLEACLAIEEAHARGIVHRDLKPANLFLAREGERATIKVLDFGISKEMLQSGEKLTQEHGIVGTVLYMSPEQIRGGHVDARSDIWSLGAVLYELIAGRTPFTGNVTQASVAIVNDDPTPLDALQPDVPPALAAVVAKALRKSPADRYADVGRLMAALKPFANAQTLAEVDAPRSSRRSLETPAEALVDVSATTLNASDRIRAPDVPRTEDGLSTETRRLSHRNQLALGAVAALVVAIAAAVTFALAPPASSSARSDGVTASPSGPLLGTTPSVTTSLDSPRAGAVPDAPPSAVPASAPSASAAASATASANVTTPPSTKPRNGRPRNAAPTTTPTSTAAAPPPTPTPDPPKPKGRPDHL